MYQIFLPHTALQPYIENYWVLRIVTQEIFQEKIIVDTQADLMFNLGSSYERSQPMEYGVSSLQKQSHLDAQRTYPITLTQTGNIFLVGVRFKIGGLSAFSANTLHEYSNYTPDLYTVFGYSARFLEESLFYAPVSHIPSILDSFFLGCFSTRKNFVYVQQIIHLIEREKGAISVQTLSQEIGYSVRQLNRLFENHVGLTPKFYGRVIRFRHALHFMHTDKSLAEVAFLSHYHDQSHFHKDFVAFTGQTPHEYRTQISVRFLQDPTAVVP